MLNKPYRKHKSPRARAAKKRQAVTAALSPFERLTRLNSMLGKGVGAVKERTRLIAKLTEDQKAIYER